MTFCYQVGGSLANESACYVERQADRELETALSRGEFCYVLNSRQMGKSSLCLKAIAKLQKRETTCIFVDLTGMGTQELTAEKWYAGIVRSIVSSCPLEINWRKWWRERRDVLTPAQRLNLFIEEVLLTQVPGKIAIFIDEIDRVLSQDFSLDDFFATIHSCYQKRQVNPDYRRLTFTMLGVAAPRDLIRNRHQSPFETGKAIALEGFELAEALPLASGLIAQNPQQKLAEILYWTGGQPFLTQKLCQLVGEKEREGTEITKIIAENIITNWENQDEPEHLRTIRDRLCYRDPSKTIRLLGLYRRILQGEEVAVTHSKSERELRLSGLIVARQGKLTVNNPIYAWVFDLTWVDKQLARLRPYSEAIARWLVSNNTDTSCLLRGQELQTALTWSLDKSLADIDYQFLVSSQKQAEREVRDALTAVETASELLATARRQAQRQASKQQLSKKWSSAIAFCTMGTIILLRYGGLLQSWEWNWLDRFFRWRLTDNIEPRITAIAIDEKDIANIGQWPLPDYTLATAIENLARHQPQAIAIDLYRDLPVAPGRQKLTQLFQERKNIYVVEKIVGDRILPPEIPQQQVGFADSIVDADGKVRRALLSVVGEDKQIRFSLGARLALDYLKTQNIELKPINNNRYLLGKANFERFQSHDGGYVNADSGGYQILLNYWGTEANFTQYSLTAVLAGEVAEADIRDRLIFIGSTAESIKDSFYTPYSHSWFGSPPKMSGVFIHANVASQIINAAMSDRPLLKTCDRPVVYLWLLFGAINGLLVAWKSKRTFWLYLNLGGMSVLFIFICYSAFLVGWWLPLIPTMLVFYSTIAACITIRNQQRKSTAFQYSLNFLLAEKRDRPLVGTIALEYFKQSENEVNRILIDGEILKKTNSSLNPSKKNKM